MHLAFLDFINSKDKFYMKQKDILVFEVMKV